MPTTTTNRLNVAFPPTGRTTNATPLVLQTYGPQLDEDSAGFFSLIVIGNDHNLGQTYWEFRVLVKRLVGGIMQGTAVQLAHSNSASASTWTASVAVVNGVIETTVTGEAGKTIDWLAAEQGDPICIVGVFA